MGRLGAWLFLGAVSALCVQCMVDLPPWARHGEAALSMPSLLGAPLANGTAAKSYKPPLDHTKPDGQKVYVRYWVNDVFFQADKPRMFFVMGGEGPAHGIGQDYVYDLASQHNALIVATEHRFYGSSLPDSLPAAYGVNFLKYLTVDQALADAAMLIDLVNVDYPGVKNNTFTFGGSYSGALSAWFRIAYPTHTRGSLSSSGVVNAILEFTEFDEHVGNVLDEKCAATLRASTQAFERALAAPSSRDSAFNLFNITNKEMLDADFYYMLADGAQMAVQYGSKIELCAALDAVGPDADEQTLMTTVSTFIKTRWGPDFANTCFYDTKCVASGPADRWTGGTDRCWRWQKCTELAYLQTAPLNPLRSTNLNLTTLIQQCKGMFGPSVIPDTNPINLRFGADEPKGTQIFFSNFNDDPWSRASVLGTVSDSLPFFLATADDVGHCADLRAPRASDAEPLKQSRKMFEGFLAKWIA